MGEYLIKQKIDTVGLLVAQSANSKAFALGLKETLLAQGKKIVYKAEYNENNTDFKTDILKIKETNAQAVYVAATTAKDATIIVKQLREANYGGLISGSTLFTLDDFKNSLGSDANGVLSTSTELDKTNPKTKEYLEKYQKRYKKESPFYAANAYDAIMIISNAVNHCNGDDTNCVKEYLLNIKNYDGVGGSTTFNSDGDVEKPIVVVQNINNNYITVE